MEYYSVLKKKEILPFATTWTELEGIMLSEGSQTEKDTCHMISLMWEIEKTKGQIHRKRDQPLVFTRGRGRVRGNWRTVVETYKLPLIKQGSTRDVMYNTKTIVNTAV